MRQASIHDLAVEGPLGRHSHALDILRLRLLPNRLKSGSNGARGRIHRSSTWLHRGSLSLRPRQASSEPTEKLLIARPRDLLVVEEATRERPLLVEGVDAVVGVAVPR
jgi:hypothetical protein